MQMPIGTEASFIGVVDLIEMQAIYWDDELGREVRYAEIPDEMKS
jgi:elongation factor G